MYKDLIIYEVFPGCFSERSQKRLIDVVERLPYLADLGVNALWITPIFKSPQKDSGYDVSNYYEVDPLHGNEEVLVKLIEEAHKLEIKIILDFVPNHTSDLHEWFIRSEENDPYYRDFYIWRKPREDREPNNWTSKKNTGSVWEYSEKRGEYYLHLYAKEQPDLNWENEKVRSEIYGAMEKWLDMGVDGFRLDVINKIAKTNLERDTEDATIYYQNMPETFNYIEEMRDHLSKKYDREIILMGQAEGSDLELGKRYQRSLDLVLEFSTNHMGRGREYRSVQTDFSQIIENFLEWQRDREYWPTIFWGSHDLPRVASRYNFDGDPRNTAKVFGVFTLVSRGTPIIYNGDEQGILNCNFNTIEEYTDVRSRNIYRLRTEAEDRERVFSDIRRWARDNARQPIDFERDLGILDFYRRCIEIRREYQKVIEDGELTYEITKDLISYRIVNGSEYIEVTFNNSGGLIKRDADRILLRSKAGMKDEIQSHEVIVEGNL